MNVFTKLLIALAVLACTLGGTANAQPEPRSVSEVAGQLSWALTLRETCGLAPYDQDAIERFINEHVTESDGNLFLEMLRKDMARQELIRNDPNVPPGIRAEQCQQIESFAKTYGFVR